MRMAGIVLMFLVCLAQTACVTQRDEAFGRVALLRDRDGGGRDGARPSRRSVARRTRRAPRQALAAGLLPRLPQPRCGVFRITPSSAKGTNEE